MEKTNEETMTMKILVNEWFSVRCCCLARSTTAGYLPYINNHVLPFFADTPVRSVKQKDIQRLINCTAGKGLSTKTQKNLRGILHSIFESYIKENGADDLERHLQKLALKLTVTEEQSKKTINSKNKGQNTLHKSLLVSFKNKKYRFPQKKLDKTIKQDDLHTMKIFYGMVSVKWEYNSKLRINKLLLYSIEKRRMICRILINRETYYKIPKKMKFEEKNNCVVSFFSELSPVEGSHYFETEISDPRCIFIHQLN